MAGVEEDGGSIDGLPGIGRLADETPVPLSDPPRQGRPPAPDLVNRDFTAPTINLKWCGDLTEVPTDEGKLDLARVEDLASRRIPGLALSEHHDAKVAVAALQMAAAVRGGDVTGVIFQLRSAQRR